MENIYKSRLGELRREMADAGINAVIIPQTDPHQSEYIASHWQIRRFFSGFTGSAGTLVVTDSEALLWTDSRYFLQAASQLEGTGIRLMKEMLPDTPSIAEYLTANLRSGDTVGVNGMLFSAGATAALRCALNARDIRLDTEFDPVDRIWTDRPGLPADKIYIHAPEHAGRDASDKISDVLAETRRQGAGSVFISALDEIAWTLNLRCNDIHCSPVQMAFLYLAPEGSVMFVNEEKLTGEVRAYLASKGVGVAPYGAFADFLQALPADRRVLVSTSQSAGAVAALLGGRCVEGSSPVAMLKACKNDVEIGGFRAAHRRDGVAMVRSLMEIGRILAHGGELTEIGVADILLRHRSAQPLFVETSFDTIAGFGPNGAIVHYSATPETDTRILPDNLLLIDSGGNYLDATTDITRTVATGTPTAEMRHDFTIVLQGNIDLAMAVFPEGTRGAQLDVLAHLPLWREGKNYLHGTGHGVGCFLNCHEGPQSIRVQENPVALRPGMVTSDEPGLYLTGRYGIRCENLLLTVDKMTTDAGKFLAFEPLTLCPFDRSLIDASMLTRAELKWLNDYHSLVWRELSPLLTADEREWLKTATAPIEK